MFTAGVELVVGTCTCTVGTGGAGSGVVGRETRTGGDCVGAVDVVGGLFVVGRDLITRLGCSVGAAAGWVVVGAMLGTAIFSPRHAGLASKGWPGMLVTKVFLSCK